MMMGTAASVAPAMSRPVSTEVSACMVAIPREMVYLVLLASMTNCMK